MARRNPQTQAKRERELAKAQKRRDKAAKREERKVLRERNTGKSPDELGAGRDHANVDEPGAA